MVGVTGFEPATPTSRRFKSECNSSPIYEFSVPGAASGVAERPNVLPRPGARGPLPVRGLHSRVEFSAVQIVRSARASVFSGAVAYRILH